MPTTIITAGGASDSLAIVSGNDGALIIQTGPSGAKVNALALDASGNGALLGTLTQGGIATPRMQLMTAVATTSGTSVDITSIPSWVKRITLMLNGVSTNGTSNYLVQIGSGSVETTGYLGAAGTNDGAGVGAQNYTTGFGIRYTAATQLVSGHLVLTLVGSNLWVTSGIFASSSNTNVCTSAGNKTTSGTLDRLRLTTVGGTDTFDLGSVNLLIEGY